MPYLASSDQAAGVYTAENDNSFSAYQYDTSIGAIVGYAERGPVMERTAVVDSMDLRERFGLKDPRLGYMHYCAEGFLTEASQLYVTRVVDGAKTGGMFVSTVNNFSECREIGVDDGLDWDKIYPSFSDTDIMYIAAANPGKWNDDIRVLFYPDTSDAEGNQFIVQVYEGSSEIPVETYTCTTYRYVNGLGNQLFIQDQINRKSKLIRVYFNTNHIMLKESPRYPLMNAITSGKIRGGTNGDTPTTGMYMEGWDLYEDWEEVEVAILINGGITVPALQAHIDEICRVRKDCVAILDPPKDKLEAQDLIDYRLNDLNISSSHSALYAPWIVVSDTDNAIEVELPPSGHVAAQLVFTDRYRDAWWAPAGSERGVIKDASSVTNIYKKGHRDMLYQNQVNAILSVRGEGVVIYGADTLQSQPSALSDLGVRRLLTILYASVRRTQMKSIHEPNDQMLWDEITQDSDDILRPIKRGRGLDWYEILCGPKTTTDAMIDNGDVGVQWFIDPTRYTKRIFINANVARTGQLEIVEQLVTQQ